MTDGPRAQLIHIETDRRLGHEWDEWDGRPLPGGGDFSAPPGLFFRYAVLTMGVSGAALVGLLYVLAPRLSLLSAALPQRLAWVLVGALAVAALSVEAGAGRRARDRGPLRGAGVRCDARPARPPGDPRAAAAGRRGGRLRARHDDRIAGRRRQAAGARAHDAAAERTVPRRPARSRRDGSLGTVAGGSVSAP